MYLNKEEWIVEDADLMFTYRTIKLEIFPRDAGIVPLSWLSLRSLNKEEWIMKMLLIKELRNGMGFDVYVQFIKVDINISKWIRNGTTELIVLEFPK